MEPCSDKFPSTDDFYAEISASAATIVLLSLACLLAALCVGNFVEELLFLQRIYYGNEVKVIKLATLLGLYPVTILTSLIALLVPSSTILLDLLASCYLSVCFYTFVTLSINYFGGEEKMLEILANDRVKTSTPPCCCCCCCILKPIKLTRKSLLFFKLCSLQVAVVRPLLLFIAAVLWTDGKYTRGLGGSTSYLYITIVTVISTLFSMYGTMVIYRASLLHLKQYSLALKYMSFKLLLVISNLQNIVFGILALFDLPECIGTRGPKVRGSYIHHSVLVIETFLLALLARKAYRRDENDIKGPITDSEEAGFAPEDIVVDKESKNVNTKGAESGFADSYKDHRENIYKSYDNPGADFTDWQAVS
ncbi:organic solute transporter subunit alpha-like [Mercenaria mercenaria]|uniref:organic solute transporter subunit alpha-like n=1 Tax=Mercenaria mercenaria TaxID=6596 RepID=UPI00234E6FC6|nr:organic solute transporter subunit alpha-like [Mercenaria mercenaria]